MGFFKVKLTGMPGGGGFYTWPGVEVITTVMEHVFADIWITSGWSGGACATALESLKT